MTAEESEERVVRRGVHEHYEWLTCTGDVYMGTVLNACPELVLGRYVAVTSIDSGVLRLSEEDLLAGWTARGGIAYSPVVTSLEQLEYQRDGPEAPGYDEWYVLETPHELAGEIFQGNMFEFQPSAAELLVFVNTSAFAPHGREPGVADLSAMFWKQMERIQPQSYIADGTDCVTLVSGKKALVDTVEETLRA